MDHEDKSLEDGSSWFSFIWFGYLSELFQVGYERPLELHDLGAISNGDRADVLYKSFHHHWKKEFAINPQVTLWRLIWLTVGYWN